MFKYLIARILRYLLSLVFKDSLTQEVDTKTNVQPEYLLGKNQVAVQSIISNVPNKIEIKKEFKIIQKLLPSSQYVQDSSFIPNQIYLHHTAGASIKSSIDYWNSNQERVGVQFCIDRNGDIYQCIPLERAWAYHLYVASPGNHIDRKYKKLGSQYDKQSIGIEIAGYGYVDPHENKFLNCYGQVVSNDKVIKLDKPFKGKLYWEKYTDEQINSLELLLLHLLEQFPKIATGIKQDYNSIFGINQDALNMIPGIYTHVSIRQDKYDCFPSPTLLNMLNQLYTKI